MSLLRRLLRGLANAVAVPILLFEEWGLRPLLALFDRLRRWRAWAWIEARIAALPPYGALLLFLVPGLLLVPVKLAALYFIAAGQKLFGLAVLIGAKLIGTVIVARIFLLTKPSLLTIPWFAAAHHAFMRWHDQVLGVVRNSAAWRAAKAAAGRVRAALQPALRRLRGWFRKAPAEP